MSRLESITNKYRAQAGLGWERFGNLVASQSPETISFMKLYRMAKGTSRPPVSLFYYLAQHGSGIVRDWAVEMIAAIEELKNG